MASAGSAVRRVKTIGYVDVARDGRTAVFDVRDVDPARDRYRSHVWLVPLDSRGGARRLTDGSCDDTMPRWSPDGKRIAFLSDRGGSQTVWTIGPRGAAPVRLLERGVRVTGFAWEPNGRGYLFVGARAGRTPHLWLVGPKGRRPRAVTPLDRRVLSHAAWSPDGTRIAFGTVCGSEEEGEQDGRVHVLTLATGRIEDVSRAGFGAWQLAWSPDGRHLAFLAPVADAVTARVAVQLWSGGPLVRDLTQSLDREVDRMVWTEDCRSLDVFYGDGVGTAVARIPCDETRPITIQPWNRSDVVHHAAPAAAGIVFVRAVSAPELWVRDTDGERRLTRINAAFTRRAAPRAERIHWSRACGTVEGVLVRPPGRADRGPLPLVVYPHGGPTARATLTLDADSRAIAGRGFLILRPNVRGSVGYGDAFMRANVGDWADGPFADLMAGVERLVADGVADPARLFFYGWSYGGFLANWAITHTNRFRAAVCGAGIADLRLQYAASSMGSVLPEFFGGSPFGDAGDAYHRQSPIEHVAGARTPTLFIWGKHDDRCPLAHALLMRRALRDRGVATDLKVYEDEGHVFRRPSAIADRGRRIVEWFTRHDVH